MNGKCLVLSSMCAIAVSAMADTSLQEDTLQELLDVKIRSVSSIALDPTLVEAVKIQNDEQLTLGIIKERDRAWRGNELNNLKYASQTSSVGRLLRSYVEHNPAFNEAFLVDNQGANVAAFPSTSDYWQGDETEWQNAFNGGKGQVHVSPLQQDESTEVEAVKVATPVLANDGSTIGVLVVGVQRSYLEARASAGQQ